LQYDRIIVADKLLTKRRDDTCGKAIRADVLRKALPYIKDRRSSIDGLIYKSCKKVMDGELKICTDPSNVWRHSISVEGLGTLSTNVMRRLFTESLSEKAFTSYPIRLAEVVPSTIARRLRSTSKFIPAHVTAKGYWGSSKKEIGQDVPRPETETLRQRKKRKQRESRHNMARHGSHRLQSASKL